MKNVSLVVLFFAYFQCSILSAQDEWTGVSPALEKRIEATSVVYQGKIYVFHGYLPGWKLSHTSEVYDPIADTWSWLAPLPSGPETGMSHNGFAIDGDKLWLVGGKSSSRNILNGKVWIYNFTEDSWEKGPSLPENIGTGSLFKLGRKLHLVGGGTHPFGSLPTLFNFCVANPNTYSLDLDSPEEGWQINQITTLPEGFIRIHAATIQYKGKTYVIGGQLGHDCGVKDIPWLHSYDPYTDTWTRLNDMPQANAHSEPSTFIIDGKIIVAGGEEDYKSHGVVYQYDIEQNLWSRIDHLRGLDGSLINRMAVSAKVIGQKMIVSHGGGGGPVRWTYTKNFPRNQVLELGFNPNDMETDLEYGDHKGTKSAWLWTTEGSVPFKIHPDALPNWLMISTDASNEVDETAVEIKCFFNSEGLAPGTYTYKLGASAPGYKDAALTIKLKVNATSAVNPPEVPLDLTQDYVSRHHVKLSWTSPGENIDFYEVYRADFGKEDYTKIAQVTDTSFTETELTPNSAYHYQVRAVNAGGSSAFSLPLHIQTKPFPPATPDDLQATVLTATSATLDWKLNVVNENDEQFYFEIYRKVDLPEFTHFEYLDETTQLYYLDENLKPDMPFAYIVRAVNSGGKSSFTFPVGVNTPVGKNPGNAQKTVEKHQLSIYPNPGDTFITLSLIDHELPGEKSLVIRDVLGNIALQKSIAVHQDLNAFKINLGQLKQGVYVITLSNAEKTLSNYFLKK